MEHVKKVTAGFVSKTDPRCMTKETMQKDFDYMMAQKMTQALLGNGYITKSEFDKITAKNKETFFPYMAELML
ncbi:MAG: hypothetical protein LKJ83_01355 [Eubacteriaceae bacterium]|jgi:hypothetical protein|nr:hypothetical protein [Eubacteriaceae bacterium]